MKIRNPIAFSQPNLCQIGSNNEVSVRSIVMSLLFAKIKSTSLKIQNYVNEKLSADFIYLSATSAATFIGTGRLS